MYDGAAMVIPANPHASARADPESPGPPKPPSPTRRRLAMRRVAVVGGVVLALVVAVLWIEVGLPGRRVPIIYAPNHVDSGLSHFDFTTPPCVPLVNEPGPGDVPDDTVSVRYLGAGGMLVRWRGAALLTAPFYTNPSLPRVLFGRLDPDEHAIDAELGPLDLDDVRALLVGHSHYDHMGDLVPVARGYARNAAIYVNPTGRHMLAPYSDLAARSKALDPHSNEWIWLRDDDDNPLPIRFRAIASDHAPHSRFFRFAHRQLTEDWTQEWSEIPIRRFVDGRTLAFVIELLDEDLATVRFRIHYQDAASGPPAGYDGLSAGLEIDLAVLCLPSAHLVEGYPEQLLAHLRVRHAMVTHYEDFFSQRDDTRFVGALTDARAASFLATVKAAADRQPDASSGPLACGCGPCADAWSMPFPGERLRFAPRP